MAQFTTAGDLRQEALARYQIDELGNIVGGTAAPLRIVDGWEIELLAQEGLNDSDKHITVPAATLYQILWVWVELTSSAVAGNRQMAVQWQDSSADVIGEVRAGAVQAASLTRYYLFAPAMADLTTFRDTDFLMTPLPPTLILSAGQVLRVFDQNIIAVNADDMVVQIQVAKRAA